MLVTNFQTRIAVAVVRRAFSATAVVAAAWLCCSAQPVRADDAAVVDVVFAAQSTRDLANGEVRPAKAALTGHLERLGKKALVPGQHLQVVVYQLALAGHLRFPRGEADSMRVLDGRSDWPRIELHYVLSSGEGVIQQGDDKLTDINYLSDPLGRNSDQPYPYEKRLLTKWFEQRFPSSKPN